MQLTPNIEIFPASEQDAKGFNIALYGHRLALFAETEEVAFLVALQHKYLGHNSDFAKLACRALGIKTEWTKF